MICCNKCGAVIEEPKEETAQTYTGAKKAAQPEQPIKRPSLVSMPVAHGAKNGFEFKDVDLCPGCMAKIRRQVNLIKMEFILSKE